MNPSSNALSRGLLRQGLTRTCLATLDLHPDFSLRLPNSKLLVRSGIASTFHAKCFIPSRGNSVWVQINTTLGCLPKVSVFSRTFLLLVNVILTSMFMFRAILSHDREHSGQYETIYPDDLLPLVRHGALLASGSANRGLSGTMIYSYRCWLSLVKPSM